MLMAVHNEQIIVKFLDAVEVVLHVASDQGRLANASVLNLLIVFFLILLCVWYEGGALEIELYNMFGLLGVRILLLKF